MDPDLYNWTTTFIFRVNKYLAKNVEFFRCQLGINPVLLLWRYR
jgi:hypothetical protein